MKIAHTTALVTGGCSGLGAATAAALTKAGAHVVVLDLPKAVESPEAGAGITYVGGDVTSAEDVQHALDQVPADAPLRVVVNCAGIAPAQKVYSSKGVHDLDLFRRTIEVNLIGTFNVMRLAAAKIAEATADEHGQRGVIINTASIAAFEGQIGQVAYSAAKGGVVGMTLVAARDMAAAGVRVVTIAPGTFMTPAFRAEPEVLEERFGKTVPFPNRMGRPPEYAALVQHIVENDYLNGEVIRLDGALRFSPK